MRVSVSAARTLQWTYRMIGIVAAIALWWVASVVFVGGGGGRIPSPVAVFESAVSLVTDDQFWKATGVTLGRGFLGLAAAVLISIVLAFLLARSRVANAALEPLVSVLYPVPRIALFPIAVIALGIGTLSQSTLVGLECVFPLTVALYAGLRSIDRSLIWLARNNDVGRWRTWALMMRMALPALFTGLRIAAPLMLTLAVATQMFTGSADGLGYLIQQSSARLQTAQIFAIAGLIGVFGFAIDQVVVLLDNLTSRHVRRASI